MPLLSRDQLYASNNRMMIRAIFVETPPFTGPLTLSKEDKKGKLSLYKLYMIYFEDPSEVNFAEAVFGDLPFWHTLAASDFFQSYIEEWRYIASEKRKNLAFKAILDEVKTGGKSAFSAAKFLIDEPWALQKQTTRDRKAIAKKNEETTAKAYQTLSVSEDFNRLKELGVLKAN